jgi:hypothetical protein
MKLFGWLRRFKDPDEMKFKDFIKYLIDNDSEEEAYKLRYEIPTAIGLFEKSKGKDVTLERIENMKWKEIKFTVDMIKREQLEQIKAYTEMLEQVAQQEQGVPPQISDDGWNKIVNTGIA